MDCRRLARILRVCGLAVTAFAPMLATSPAGLAQAPATVTLEEILDRLESNLHHYDADVPSFFCDEHVVSKVVPSELHQETVTESTFRLKRTLASDQKSASLDESREIKTVDGRPAAGQQLGGPALLSGGFSGGLALVTTGQQICMDYKLRPVKHAAATITVEFATGTRREFPPECLLREEGRGRVIVDAKTMQIKHMELTVPHHLMDFGKAEDGSSIPPLIGRWNVSVDYAPVLFGGQPFWMPTTINSTVAATNTVNAPAAASGGSSRSRGGRSSGAAETSFASTTTWDFSARYRNYHKLEVTSRIVPTVDVLP